jgi:hypothetical protein
VLMSHILVLMHLLGCMVPKMALLYIQTLPLLPEEGSELDI